MASSPGMAVCAAQAIAFSRTKPCWRSASVTRLLGGLVRLVWGCQHHLKRGLGTPLSLLFGVGFVFGSICHGE